MKHLITYDEHINEAKKSKGKEWADIENRGGESSSRMRVDNTTKIKILRFIFDAGSEGRRYTDIVKYIVEKVNKRGKYDYKTNTKKKNREGI